MALLLSLGSTMCSGSPYDTYMAMAPLSLVNIDTIYALETRVCFCGLDTSLMPNTWGSRQPMMTLAHAGYNWAKGMKLVASMNKDSYLDSYANTHFVGSSMWYSPFGGSFVNYGLPVAMMTAVMEGWVEIASKAEVTLGAPACKAYLGYFSDNWSEYPNIKIKDGAKQDEFYEKMSVPGVQFMNPKTKKIRYYPSKLSDVNMDWGAYKKKPKKMAIEDFMAMEQGNAIVCDTSVKRGEEEEQKGVMVFLDYLAKYKVFIVPGELPGDWEGKNIYAVKHLQIMAENMNVSNHGDKKVSNLAFMWSADSELKKNADATKEEIAENLLLPSTFMNRVCDLMLNPNDLGALWNFSLEEIQTMYREYQLNCPMLGNVGKMMYGKQNKENRNETDWFVRKTYFGPGVPGDFLPDKADGSKPLLNNLFHDIHIEGDASGLKFEKGGEYDAELEGQNKIRQDVEDKEAEKEAKSEPSEDEGESEDTKSIPDQGDPSIPEDSSQSSEQEGEDKGSQSNDEEEDDPKKQNVAITVEDEAAMLDMEEWVRNCENEIIQLEKDLQDKVPKTKELALNDIYRMMTHPHVDDGCKTLYNMTYDLVLADGRIEVYLKQFLTPVAFITVKVVNPLVYKPREGDTKVVFQVLYENAFFKDEKHALYYIPDREIVNEWDKFYIVLYEFFEFAMQNRGEKLSIRNVFDKMSSRIEQNIKTTGWMNNEVGTGVPNTIGYASADEVKEAFKFNRKYVLHFFRLENNKEGFYDFIFQCWTLGEKYLMVKINGTRFTYSVMINVYSNPEDLAQIWNHLYTELYTNFISQGSQSVVTLKQAKREVWDTSMAIALRKHFGWEESLDTGEEEEPTGYIQAHETIESEHLDFWYRVYLKNVDEPINIRGLVHLRENIPVLNLFFSSEKFEAEYIVPLSHPSSYRQYIADIFNEVFSHLYQLLLQISVVEDEDITEQELDENQKLGRYSMKKIFFKVLKMLATKKVYGCLRNVPSVPMSERDPETFEYNLDPDAEEEGAEDPEEKRRYKWTQPEPKDLTGEILILRSNFMLANPMKSACLPDEMFNPVLIHLYPTWLDERAGYALTINSPSHDGMKELKTTYHFVKYQDYAHMKVLEHFISNIFDQIFEPMPIAVKPEGED